MKESNYGAIEEKGWWFAPEHEKVRVSGRIRTSFSLKWTSGWSERQNCE